MSEQVNRFQGIREIQWLNRDVWWVTQPWGELIIAKMGAQVLHYQPTGELPVFWLHTDTGPLSAGYQDRANSIAEREPVRAGAPLCWPWFGPHESDITALSHGVARVNDWQLQSCELQSSTSNTTKLRFVPGSSLSEQLSVVFEVEVSSDKLQMSIMTTNLTHSDQPLTQAIHSYFSVSNSQNIVIKGLLGCEYIDKLQDNSRFKQQQELASINAIDSIFIHESTVELIDQAFNRKLIIDKAGSASTVVWNPGAAFEKFDILKGSNQFVCVEAANTAHESLVVRAGQSVALTQSIKIEPLS